MQIVEQSIRDQMRSDIFGSEVWARLPWTARWKLWWYGRRSREEARAAFDLAISKWFDSADERMWRDRASFGVVDPVTLWLIGMVISLLFQWFLRNRESNGQTLRIMRG